MNFLIDSFIFIAISTFLSVLFIFTARLFAGKYKKVENIRIGATISVLMFSCFLNGFLICWLLVVYQYLPKPI